MSDPYRLGDSPAPAPASRPTVSGGRIATRMLLWIVAIGGAGTNMIMNLGGTSVIGILAGSIGVLAIIGLVISYVRGRRK